jgi:hypothetical protein
MSSAARTREWYRRRRAGKAIFALELDEVGVERLVERAGLLQPLEADDHAVVERALERLVEMILLEDETA